MCVCTCVCVCVHARACVRACVCVYACVRACVCKASCLSSATAAGISTAFTFTDPQQKVTASHSSHCFLSTLSRPQRSWTMAPETISRPWSCGLLLLSLLLSARAEMARETGRLSPMELSRHARGEPAADTAVTVVIVLTQ